MNWYTAVVCCLAKNSGEGKRGFHASKCVFDCIRERSVQTLTIIYICHETFIFVGRYHVSQDNSN